MPIVSSYKVDRGRDSELDRTGTGTATITMIDTNRSLDPAGGGGSSYDPLTPVAIALGGAPIFVGHVSRWGYDMYPTMTYGIATLECVDALDILAATEMVADYTLWGDPSAQAIYEGNIRFDADTQVKHRIDQILDQAGDVAAREVFTGNVALNSTTYSPGQTALNAIQDAADAEFPAVANFFIGKDGTRIFHGRLARFNPSDGQYHITTWNCGDVANQSGRAVISGLEYDKDKDRIINQAFCTPEGVKDSQIPNQYVRDTGSIAQYGTRAWSAENLILRHSWLTGKTAAAECRDVYAQYYVTNYKQPEVQVRRLSFRWQPPGTAYAANTNALMSGIDISDRIQLTTSNGFNAHYFVEGLHYEAHPATSTYLDVTLDVDLSPAAYWNTLPG
jgi:hypothetical protein